MTASRPTNRTAMDYDRRIAAAKAAPTLAEAERIIITKRPGNWQLHILMKDGTRRSFASFEYNPFTHRLVTDTALRAVEMRAPTACVVMLDMSLDDRATLLQWTSELAIANAPFEWDVDHLDELEAEASA